ncbi:MAG TPA: DUF2238 domain-containing protein [Methylophilus sp.]
MLQSQRSFFSVLLGIGVLVFAWSAYQPRDTYTWLLEVMPVMVALPVLWFTYPTFPLTRLVYVLILLHVVILMVGGHYTYAEVPAFNWLRDYFDLTRNYYDRVGHFAQGFVPAMIAREILMRKQVVKPGAWLFFVVCCICLSISAFYELIEWWVALLSAQAADAFLGTQGDVWDTQWDMLIALIGAISAQVFLANWHDKGKL